MKKNVIILLLAAFSINMQAQIYTIEAEAEYDYVNFRMILDEDRIFGYSLLYKKDKLSKTETQYIIRILDENLNMVTEKEFIDDRKLYISEADFNGQDILFELRTTAKAYRDERQKLIYLRTYNISNNKLSDKFTNVRFEKDYQVGRFVPIKDVGFLNIQRYFIKKKFDYAAVLLDKNNERIWTYRSERLSKSQVEWPYIVGYNEDMFVLILEKNKFKKYRERIESLAFFDMSDGHKINEKDLITDDYKLELLKLDISKERDEVLALGKIHSKKKSIDDGKPLGLFRYIFNKKGEVKEQKHFFWKDASQFFEMDKTTGKNKEKGFPYFHDFIVSNKGDVFVVGEFFTGNPLTGKVKITDMFYFLFDNDFNLQNLHIVEKTKTKMNAGQAGGVRQSAQIVKNMGGFDYEYSQKIDDGNGFISFYFDKLKDPKIFSSGDAILGMVTYYNGKFRKEKISLKKKGGKIGVISANPGYIIVVESFRAERKVELRLEKVNY